MFAAEFDDASFSYSESDEERAPNYVVTPTGARVNRLFAVGVLTEVEQVNDDVLRGRIVDPTGAFVSYAGQYQPDEMAFLDRASPPAFVALSGKARTFQPEDSDRVFTSVRPESMSRVDADTRDRWTVSTAEATLDRVGVMAAALRSGLRGGALSDALRDADVDEPLAKGIPLAIDHYGTTPGYLAALRRLALDALGVVANDRDSVRPFDREPGEASEGVDLDSLAADLDLSAPEGRDAAEARAEEATAPSTDTATEATESTEAISTDDTESVPEFDGTAPEPTAETSTSPAESAPETTATEADAPSSESTSTTTESGESDIGGEESEDTGAATPADAPSAPESAESTETTEPTETGESTPTEPVEASAGDELGDFDSDTTSEGELGDFDADDAEDAASTPSNETDATTGEATAPEPDTPDTSGADVEAADAETADDPTAVDTEDDAEEGMYELDAEERAQIEEEFGTEFSTGSEVAPAGEADIDVPSVDELEEELDEEAGAENEADESAAAATPDGTTATADATSEAANEPEGAADATEATDESETADDAGADEAPEDVDLEAVAVEAMDDLDDGDGASREAVVARVVDEYGVDPEAVEDAIQSALMSGQCYEPTEDSLKAI
ncbi:hypothetical protein C2R22_08860 [Salinigranum rubrum]|uniref:Rpa-associated protein n=1 Tax=Salinigranum rubrum TaxID=755307 RepID=A0A2I8VPY3_9EURY|nr:hypothetical protein C2R22_08860 [Salinigranum rubrum]